MLKDKIEFKGLNIVVPDGYSCTCSLKDDGVLDVKFVCMGDTNADLLLVGEEFKKYKDLKIYTLDTDVSLIGKEVVGFKLDNVETTAIYWNDMFHEVTRTLIYSCKDEFDVAYSKGVFSKKGNSEDYIVKNATVDKARTPLGRSYYADKSINSETVKTKLKALFEAMSKEYDTLLIYTVGKKKGC